MHNIGANASPIKKSLKMVREFVELSKICCFLTYFSRNTPIFWGTGAASINAYFLGKDLLKREKFAEFGWDGDLMNRLIHRSWGEGFVNIFLDLFINISHLFSSTCICALGRTEVPHIYEGVAGATSLVRRPFRNPWPHPNDSPLPMSCRMIWVTSPLWQKYQA